MIGMICSMRPRYELFEVTGIESIPDFLLAIQSIDPVYANIRRENRRTIDDWNKTQKTKTPQLSVDEKIEIYRDTYKFYQASSVCNASRSSFATDTITPTTTSTFKEEIRAMWAHIGHTKRRTGRTRQGLLWRDFRGISFYQSMVHLQSPTTKSGVAYVGKIPWEYTCRFTRRYRGNPCWFLFLRLLICLSSVCIPTWSEVNQLKHWLLSAPVPGELAQRRHIIALETTQYCHYILATSSRTDAQHQAKLVSVHEARTRMPPGIF